MIQRMVPALYVEDLARSSAFYCELLGLRPGFEADWIVQLSDPENPAVELVLQPVTHDLVPEPVRGSPRGAGLTFVVPDCDVLYEKARAMGLQILQEPKDEDYGQRRFLTMDPDGMLIDVSSNCEPSPEFMAKYFDSQESG